MQTTQTVGDKLKEMLRSKKFIAYIGGIVALLLTTFGIEVEEDKVVEIISLIIAIAVTTSSYLISQGLADAGKEAMKIDKEL